MSNPSLLIAAAVTAHEAVTAAREVYQRTADDADQRTVRHLDIDYIGALSQAIDAYIADGCDPADEATLRALPSAETLILARTADPATNAAFDAAQRHPLADYIVDWSTFWDADETEHEWLIEPMFATGRAHAIYAGAKTGKSYTVLAACAALVTGNVFLGRRNEPCSVLYVDYEMTADDIRDRLTEFGYGRTDDLSGLHYALLPSLPPLDTREGGDALLASAQAVGAQLVIIDTTGRALQGEENSADAIRDYYRHTGSKLKREGITAARLDHAGKELERGQRGSSAKNDDVDVVWAIKRTDDGQMWAATHRRMSWVPEKVSITTDTGDDGVTVFTTTTGTTWPAGTKECAEDLDELIVDVGVSARSAGEILKLHGKGRRAEVVRAAVRFRVDRRETEWLNVVQEHANPARSEGTEMPRRARPDIMGRASQPKRRDARPDAVGRGAKNPMESTGRGAGRGGTRYPEPPRPDLRVTEGDAVGAGCTSSPTIDPETDPIADLDPDMF